MLHAQRLVGIDRREVAELGAVANLLGIQAVDGRDLGEAGALVAAARRTQRALDDIARAQARGANEVCGHKGVVVGLHVAVGMDDAGTIRANLQDALYVAEALGLRGGGVDLLDELGLLFAGRLDLELLGLLAQLSDLHGRELLARKRGLGRCGVALLVALLAVALTVATVVVALVLALVALLVTLVLTTVVAGVLVGLGGRGAIGCGGIGIGRGLAAGLGVGVGAGLGFALLLGGLGLCGLLARTLGLLASRLIGVLGLGGGVDSCLGGLVGSILGGILIRTLCLHGALGSGTTAATGTDIGRLALGGCGGLSDCGFLDRSVGCKRGLGRRRRPSCGSGGLLGLHESLGLAATTMRTQGGVDDRSLAGLGGRCRARGLRALPRCGTSRGFDGLEGRLLGILLGLGGGTATRTGSRLLHRLVVNASLGNRRRLGRRRGRQLGQGCGLALGSATTGAHDLGLANLRQCAGLRDLVGNRRRGVGRNGALDSRRARGAAPELCGLLTVRRRLSHTARTLGLYGRGVLARGRSDRSDLLSRCGLRCRGSLGSLGSRSLNRRGHRDLVRRNRCSGSGMRRRYFVFLLLIRHSVCSTFFSSPVITCSLHIPSGRLNSLAPS